jgi:hypothetical protein
VRFTPVIIPPGQPGAGYYIGPGSWWISEMDCLPLHYDYNCCQPAVYVQPNSPGPDCTNGVFIAMPPAVCDGWYGSLWMGRVDQSTTDAHACDNYVANRNNGAANPSSCEPQIELDLFWHEDGGGYETFVAPLGFSYGGPPLQLARIAVDANRDGDITFDAQDQTTAAQPYRFWVNNDHDGYCTLTDESTVQDDLDPSTGSDADNVIIACTRDLEDYTRLWIDTQGITTELQNGRLLLALEWKEAANDPRIQFFQAAEADGGTLYLTDTNTAQQQVSNYGTHVIEWAHRNVLTKYNPFIFPPSYWATLPGDASVAHLLFDAVSRGSGRLVVSLYKSDGETKLAEGSPLYLNLQDVKEMYERWTVGEGNGGAPFNTVAISQARLPAGVSTCQYDAQSPELNQYILFVHGWNLQPWERDAFAETAFKRLWWQGYKGRFGAFQWPTTYWIPTGLPYPYDDIQLGLTFDPGEQTAWQAAVPLEQLLIWLHQQYGSSVYAFAHSMGNVVMGEALRRASQDGLGQLVNTYIACQAAVSANCYDATLTGTDLLDFGPLGVWGPTTPNIYNNWMAGAAAAALTANFYNTNDYALHLWETDQVTKPDNRADYSWGYDSTDYTTVQDLFYRVPTIGSQTFLHLGTPADVMDRYEIMARAAESRSKALGAVSSVAGFAPQNLTALWPPDTFPGNNYSAHPWHSAQFRFTNMEQKGYWDTLLGPAGFDLK